MRELFISTLDRYYSRVLGYFRNKLNTIGYGGNRKIESERLAQEAIIKAYQSLTLELCQKYGQDKGAPPGCELQQGCKVLLFLIATNIWSKYIRPRRRKTTVLLPLESVVSFVSVEEQDTEGLSPEQKIAKIQSYFPPSIFHLFVRRSLGASYKVLAEENKCSVKAIRQKIHRWKQKAKKHFKSK